MQYRKTNKITTHDVQAENEPTVKLENRMRVYHHLTLLHRTGQGERACRKYSLNKPVHSSLFPPS